MRERYRLCTQKKESDKGDNNIFSNRCDINILSSH